MRQRYLDLLRRPIPVGIDSAESLRLLDEFVALATDFGDDTGFRHAIEWGDALADETLPASLLAPYHYILGNAWSELQRVRQEDMESPSLWEQPEHEKALIHYRRAIAAVHQDPSTAPDIYARCQTMCNAANLYDQVGRPTRAFEYWSAALALCPAFAMGWANRGLGLRAYAAHEHDAGHQAMLLYQAKRDLERALQLGLPNHAVQLAFDAYQALESDFADVPPHSHPEAGLDDLGDAPDEQAYRSWCLSNTLFLSTLNDIGPLVAAAHDVIHLPSFVARIHHLLEYHRFYNQMKQEYATARYFLYDGLSSTRTHFSDHGVRLLDAGDRAAVGLAVEKIKLSFRMAYSLLDKSACFLNSYLDLGVHRASFRNIWYVGGKRDAGMNPSIIALNNRPLLGLLWLSKDLQSGDSEYDDAIEPDAVELVQLRNQLEHGMCQVHDGMYSVAGQETIKGARRVHRLDLGNKTLRMVRMCREALLYLAQAIYVEDARRKGSAQGETIQQVQLDAIGDGDKS